MNKIALAMIVKGTKDEAELLEQCLSNVSKHVDGIFLNINHAKGKKVAKEIEAIATKYKATTIITEWKGNFVEARTESFAMVTPDYTHIIWLDSDDTLDKPEQLRYVVNSMTKAHQGVYIVYDYDHDEDGNVTLSHWVARIVRNNGSYEWRSSISDNGVSVHETLNEVVPRPKVLSNDFHVVHHAGADRRLSSLVRNIELLEGMFKKQKAEGKFDPRTLFYLATHYYDAGNLEDAAMLLRHYMTVSGWAEERCEALVYLGNICIRFNQDDEAHRMFLAAIGEYQNSPRPYIGLAELDFIKGRFQESANWIEKCLQLPEETTTMVKRPMENSYRAYMLGAQSCANVGGKLLDKALIYVKKALKLRPTDSDANRALELVDELIENRENIKAASRLINKFEKDKHTDKIVPFINALPSDTQDNPLIMANRFKFVEPKVWGSKDIAIYCGQGPLGIWGPWSLEKGIGGSEEAVIQLSTQLANMGWNVTVYATPGDKAGIYYRHGSGGDVCWKQYYEFNPKDEYNVVISWRNPAFFDADIKAKKKYLWLHDVMEKAEFFKERLDNIDKVIFVGKYHAELYKGVIPEEKWFISGNGIDPEAFMIPDRPRTKHRMIYMSAYNRGLKVLLQNWDAVKKAVPDATLDIYYGWDSYDAINQNNPERMQWKADLVKLIDSCDGVTDHGKIGHKQIIEEIKSADIFAYPCVFNEVYCISYVKAMAGGAYPVSSDYAELVAYKDDGGIQVHYEEGNVEKFAKDYTKQIIMSLKVGVSDDVRKEMSKTALSKYTWEATAKDWSKEFSK